MALTANLTALIAAANALTAGETASYIVTESLLKANIVALDTWVKATDNGYSIAITKLFSNNDTSTYDKLKKDVNITEGEEYFMVTCAVPAT